jgi:hypothetical protein
MFLTFNTCYVSLAILFTHEKVYEKVDNMKEMYVMSALTNSVSYYVW